MSKTYQFEFQHIFQRKKSLFWLLIVTSFISFLLFFFNTLLQVIGGYFVWQLSHIMQVFIGVFWLCCAVKLITLLQSQLKMIIGGFFIGYIVFSFIIAGFECYVESVRCPQKLTQEMQYLLIPSIQDICLFDNGSTQSTFESQTLGNLLFWLNCVLLFSGTFFTLLPFGVPFAVMRIVQEPEMFGEGRIIVWGKFY